MNRKLALLLFVCFFLSILAVSFHHHEDGECHDDCSICFHAVYHSNAVSVDVPLVGAPVSFEAEAVPLLSGLTYSHLLRSPQANRAPPPLL